MTTTTLILVILLWPLCLFIIGLILLQGGAGDISSAFGGGGQLDSTLGVGAGRKMSKLTAWLAGAFLLVVLMLSLHSKVDLGKYAGSPVATPPATPASPKAPVVPGAPAIPIQRIVGSRSAARWAGEFSHIAPIDA